MYDESEVVDVIYPEFQKPLYTVLNQGLLAKTDSHGMNEVVLCWIRSWLTDHKHRIMINGQASEWLDIITRHESVLGLVLFLICY